MMRRSITYALISLALIACTSSTSENDLQSWMHQLHNSQSPNLQSVDPPKKFNPQPYISQNLVDPFSTQRLFSELKTDAPEMNKNILLLIHEQARKKDLLESYPLDSLTMVGSLQKNGKQIALIKTDKLIHQIQSGEHMGKNFGKVTKITETTVFLREIIQDASGEWIEQETTMLLQESLK